MSDDDKPPMPPQPATTPFPVVPAWAIELTKSVKEGFRALDEKVDRLEYNLDLQGGEIGLVKKEVGLLYDWKGDVEQRLKNNSTRAQRITDVDLAQDAKLADALMRLDEEKRRSAHLEATSATKDDVAKMLAEANHAQTAAIVEVFKSAGKNPLVQKIAWAAGLLILQAIAVATSWLVTKGH